MRHTRHYVLWIPFGDHPLPLCKDDTHKSIRYCSAAQRIAAWPFIICYHTIWTCTDTFTIRIVLEKFLLNYGDILLKFWQSVLKHRKPTNNHDSAFPYARRRISRMQYIWYDTNNIITNNIVIDIYIYIYIYIYRVI